MALTSTGPDIALKRNPQTGRFNFDMSTSGTNKGNPLLSSDRTHSVMTTLFSWKRGRRAGDPVESGGYYPDQSGRRGTLLWTVIQDTSATRSQLLAAADDARQQLLDERLITSLTAEAERQPVSNGLRRWSTYLTWTLPQGERKEQRLTL